MSVCVCVCCCVVLFFFQAEDGIRDLVRSRGLGDVYKRQERSTPISRVRSMTFIVMRLTRPISPIATIGTPMTCLLYTSDAADERSSVDLGGRRIIKKKTMEADDGDSMKKKSED